MSIQIVFVLDDLPPGYEIVSYPRYVNGEIVHTSSVLTYNGRWLKIVQGQNVGENIRRLINWLKAECN